MEGLPTGCAMNGVKGVSGWDAKYKKFLEVIPVEALLNKVKLFMLEDLFNEKNYYDYDRRI